jgi:putative transposase
VLAIGRSTVYYEPRPVSETDLWPMRRIDELHLSYPFAGSRMLRGLLGQQGLVVGRRHIKTPMRKIAIETIYRRSNTSKPAPGHRIYPYLLRGFIYLAAVVDWFSRRVLAWELSIAMETSFCVEALEEALSANENRRYSIPAKAASSPAKPSPGG